MAPGQTGACLYLTGQPWQAGHKDGRGGWHPMASLGANNGRNGQSAAAGA